MEGLPINDRNRQQLLADIMTRTVAPCRVEYNHNSDHYYVILDNSDYDLEAWGVEDEFWISVDQHGFVHGESDLMELAVVFDSEGWEKTLNEAEENGIDLEAFLSLDDLQDLYAEAIDAGIV